jgi:hypothetical protein
MIGIEPVISDLLEVGGPASKGARRPAKEARRRANLPHLNNF